MPLPQVPDHPPPPDLLRLAVAYVEAEGRNDGTNAGMDGWSQAREAFKAAIAESPMSVAIAIINRALRT